jgi:hypothetical protein
MREKTAQYRSSHSVGRVRIAACRVSIGIGRRGARARRRIGRQGGGAAPSCSPNIVLDPAERLIRRRAASIRGGGLRESAGGQNISSRWRLLRLNSAINCAGLDEN